MQHLIITLLIAYLIPVQDTEIQGVWTTIDDASGKAKSEVVLSIKDNRLYGTINRLLLPEDVGALCTKCKGKDRDQPIEGLIIIRGLSFNEDHWESGDILDPKNGRFYRCSIRLKDPNTLEVRGYLGFSVFGRTQVWKKNQ